MPSAPMTVSATRTSGCPRASHPTDTSRATASNVGDVTAVLRREVSDGLRMSAVSDVTPSHWYPWNPTPCRGSRRLPTTSLARSTSRAPAEWVQWPMSPGKRGEARDHYHRRQKAEQRRVGLPPRDSSRQPSPQLGGFDRALPHVFEWNTEHLGQRV